MCVYVTHTTTNTKQNQKIAPTDDNQKYTWDVTPQANVRAIFTHNGLLKEGETSTVGTHETVGIILDKSTYYPEAGGQVADTGQSFSL